MSDRLDDSIKDHLGETREVPPGLVQKAKDLMPAAPASPAGRRPGVGKCPHCGKSVTPFKEGGTPPPWNWLWFALAGAALALSFVFKLYFMQFLVLTLLLGFKGIVDQRARKTQILIYKALSGEEGGQRHRLHQHTTRL